MKRIGILLSGRGSNMVALADALDGEGALVNYVGVSYGTLLGAWFVNSECRDLL